MNRKRKRLIVGTLLVVEVLICAAIVVVLAMSRFFDLPRNARLFYVADTRAEETVEQSFAADGPATLDLTNTYGDVQIAAGESDQIVVKAIKEAWGQDTAEAKAKLQALQVKMAMDGGALRVQVEDPDRETSVVFGASRASRVRFEVAVPRQTSVVVDTRNGNITLKNSQGDADLTSRYGQVSVENVRGSLTVDANYGNVMVRRCGSEQATVDLYSRYGDITVRQVTAKELTLETNNGVLTLEDATIDGDPVLSTQYGRIDLDGVVAKSLKVKSQNGPIALNDGQLDGALDVFTRYGAVSVAATEAGEYKIETNNGAIKLDGGHDSLWLHSNYGDITVRGAQDATLDLSSGNGKITFEGSLAAKADHEVASNYGAVSLRLPPDTAVYLDAETNYGRIRCEFDVLVKGSGDDNESRSSGDELRGTINGGGKRLRIKTRNGDIAIEVELSE